MEISFELPKGRKEDIIGTKSLSKRDIRETVIDALCEGFRIPPEAILNLRIKED